MTPQQKFAELSAWGRVVFLSAVSLSWGAVMIAVAWLVLSLIFSAAFLGWVNAATFPVGRGIMLAAGIIYAVKAWDSILEWVKPK